MARITTLGIPPTPCQLDPDAWRDHTNAAAKKACRTQCPKRFACAKEAVTIEKIRTLNGVVAGIACPPDNNKGNSKTLTHAIDQLRSLAEFGAPRRSEPAPRPVVVAVTTPAAPLQLSFDDLLQAC
ncbi:hypothetical protein [Mycobacteroides abscessus]|uniref:hypothetical protein n=1 Tax=Mycobacteroides abscessus TaxID=36809 RepID=UPI0003123B38|nr:hypothetical protein [Mycobacteroides abscessus]SLJ71114.1 transcription factor WhiB family protein [Mycobacteroides abscessus subsp. abscessus]